MQTDPLHFAFPVPFDFQEEGLTKREYFASDAYKGLLSRGCHGRLAAMEAVKAADLLIEELNKSKGTVPGAEKND